MLWTLPLLLAVAQEPATFELVETAPVETTLDHPDLREAHEVWLEMIGGAEKTIDLGMFYASNRPGSRLEPVIVALEEAAERGVRVRFLSAESFYDTYPGTLDRLKAREGIDVRLIDFGDGVLHAKYFVVDGREVFFGSQNFDWRALEHIQELGVRVRSSEIGSAFAEVFEHDWRLAAGGDPVWTGSRESPPPVEADGVRLTPTFSPRSHVRSEAHWDLPRLVEMIDGAERTVRVQLLSYHGFDELESALLRAAKRGVEVRLLLSHWCKRESQIRGLQELQRVEGIDVKLATIPEHSSGFIPYCRVINAKDLVVDVETSWIGTSNWSRGYFHESRNVGLILEGKAPSERLDRFFLDGWDGDYAELVDPEAEYEAPRVGD